MKRSTRMSFSWLAEWRHPRSAESRQQTGSGRWKCRCCWEQSAPPQLLHADRQSWNSSTLRVKNLWAMWPLAFWDMMPRQRGCSGRTAAWQGDVCGSDRPLRDSESTAALCLRATCYDTK
ncbi:hypothetical protein DPEC_G00364100 [Dallia pectoralis]|nr:hypothetical protein DPEC_G00364100 [Dallia pectoralis]